MAADGVCQGRGGGGGQDPGSEGAWQRMGCFRVEGGGGAQEPGSVGAWQWVLARTVSTGVRPGRPPKRSTSRAPRCLPNPIAQRLGQEKRIAQIVISTHSAQRAHSAPVSSYLLQLPHRSSGTHLRASHTKTARSSPAAAVCAGGGGRAGLLGTAGRLLGRQQRVQVPPLPPSAARPPARGLSVACRPERRDRRDRDRRRPGREKQRTGSEDTQAGRQPARRAGGQVAHPAAARRRRLPPRAHAARRGAGCWSSAAPRAPPAPRHARPTGTPAGPRPRPPTAHRRAPRPDRMTAARPQRAGRWCRLCVARCHHRRASRL